MKYNIAKNTQILLNMVEGNKPLTYAQLMDLIDSNSASISLSGSDILVIEFDLGERLFVDEIRYYFSSSDPPDAVISGISFYASQYDIATITGTDYIKLDSAFSSSYYHTTITGAAAAPRWIKIVHTVSGTSVSGVATALQILTNEDIVDFGSGGAKTSERFDLSIYYDQSDIKEIPIFNDGPASADAYVVLEPQYTLADSILQISTSPSGVWRSSLDENNVVCGPDKWGTQRNFYHPDILHSGTLVYNNAVVLQYDQTVGVYTSCIYEKPNSDVFSYILHDIEYPVVYSGVEFFDDFSSLNGDKWTITQGSASFVNGFLAKTSSSLNCQTKDLLEFGWDWEVLMRISWASTHPTDYNNMVYKFYSYLSSSESCFLGVNSAFATPNIRFFLNNNSIHTHTLYNAYNEIGNWFWLRVKRTRTQLMYKLWKDGNPEPNWDFVYSLAYPLLLLISARICLLVNDYATSPYSLCRLDDVVLWTNCSVAGQQGLVSVDPTDVLETIELRSSNKEPESYHVYAQTLASGNTFSLELRYFKNDSLIGAYPITYSYLIVFNSFSAFDEQAEVIWRFTTYQVGSYRVRYLQVYRLRLRDNTSSNADLLGVTESSMTSVRVKYLVPIGEEGCWAYFYFNGSSGLEGSGYYLIFINNSLSRQFTIRNASRDFVSGMCIAHRVSGHLWYANNVSSTVLKISTNGTVLASYDVVGRVKNLCEDGIGGCYVLLDNAIIRLDLNAKVIGAINVSEDIMTFCVDKDNGGFWLLNGASQLLNIDSLGNIMFSSEVYGVLMTDLRPVYGGVWCKCDSVRQWRFFDKKRKTFVKSLDAKSPAEMEEFGYTDSPGFLSKKFVASEMDVRFPMSYDEHWQNLPWRKVSLRNYLLPKHKYVQMRFTLRASLPGAVSPLLKTCRILEPLKIENIPSGQSKPIYVKADVSSLNESQLGQYVANLKTWWYVPE